MLGMVYALGGMVFMSKEFAFATARRGVDARSTTRFFFLISLKPRVG